MIARLLTHLTAAWDRVLTAWERRSFAEVTHEPHQWEDDA